MRTYYFGSILLALALMPALSSAQWSVGKSNAQSGGLPTGDPTVAVTNLMKWILGIFGAIAIIAFAVAGIIYLTSAGDEGRTESAKKAMIYSIIGVIVGLIGMIAVVTIEGWLS